MAQLGYDPRNNSYQADPEAIKNAPTGDYDKQWAKDDRNARNFGRITRERLEREAAAEAQARIDSGPQAWSGGDFPNNDPAKDQYPTDYSGVDIDSFNQRALPPTSQELMTDLMDMLRGSATDSNQRTNEYSSDQRDALLGGMVPEAGGVRSGGYLDDRYRQGMSNNESMNDLQIQNVLNELLAKQSSAQGSYGAATGCANGRRDMIFGQQDARSGRVGNQLNNYETMMFDQLGQEEGAAQDYRSLLEEGARGRRSDGRADMNAGYDRAIDANNRRQTEIEANNRDYGGDPYNQMGAETKALLQTSRMMSNGFAQTMADIDESIEIDRALGIASEFSTARTGLKQKLWAARSQLENEVATTKDTAALDAFDTISAANATLAGALGAAGITSSQDLGAIAQATMKQDQDLEQALAGAKFAANSSFAADKYAADQSFQSTVLEINTMEQQGKISSASAREQIESAKATEQQAFNLQSKRGADLAGYFGYSERAWAAMAPKAREIIVEASVSGDMIVDIDGQQVAMSPDVYVQMQNNLANQQLNRDQQAIDVDEQNQQRQSELGILERAAAAGMDITALITSYQKQVDDEMYKGTGIDPPSFETFVFEQLQLQGEAGAQESVDEQAALDLATQEYLQGMGLNVPTGGIEGANGSSANSKIIGPDAPTLSEIIQGIFEASRIKDIYGDIPADAQMRDPFGVRN